MSDDKIILETDDESAKLTTFTGWVSRKGNFFGNDERRARFHGATHHKCACGNVYTISGYCRPCHIKMRADAYAALPKREWAGEPLCLFDGDEYFFSVCELREYVENIIDDPATVLSSLPLVFCVPNMASEIDPRDYYCDELTEDGEIPAAIEEAFAALNAVIRNCKTPLSWSPGKVAAIVTLDQLGLDNAEDGESLDEEPEGLILSKEYYATLGG